MKQQHLLFFAMAILVLYSLIFQQEQKYQSRITSNHIKFAEAKRTQKLVNLYKFETIKFQLMETEPCLSTTLEIIAKPTIQVESYNFVLPPL